MELPSEFPESEKRRAICKAHIAGSDEVRHIEEDFRLSEQYRLPDGTSDIYAQTVCAGLSCIAKALGRDCALHRRQYDSDGRLLSELKY